MRGEAIGMLATTIPADELRWVGGERLGGPNSDSYSIAPQASVCPGIPWRASSKADSDPVSLGWCLRFCIFNKLMDDV